MWTLFDSVIYGLGVTVLAVAGMAALILFANVVESIYKDHVAKVRDTRLRLIKAQEDLELVRFELAEAKTKLDAASPVTDGGYRERTTSDIKVG